MAEETLPWYRAVTLHERLAASRGAFSSSLDSESTLRNDAVRFRMDSWTSQRPFQNPDSFRRRLEADGITEVELARLIAEPPDAVRRRVGSALPWIATIESALSSTPSFEFHAFLTERQKQDPTVPFIDVAAPFVDLAMRRLSIGLLGIERQSGSIRRKRG